MTGIRPLALVILAVGVLLVTQTIQAQETTTEQVTATATETMDAGTDAVQATVDTVTDTETAAPDTEEAAEDVAYLPQSTADILWLLVGGILVMFMQAGFAMVETGLTRAKNATNIMSKNLMDFCLGSLLYWAIGYNLMYGEQGNGFLGWGTDFLFMGHALNAGADSAGAFGNAAGWFFQMVFCATAATIVSGAMAERTKLISYLFYSVIISAIIYPIAGHWIWGGDGWLAAKGMRDFAGSTVVHSVGAWAALAGAMVVGPRIGKYNADGSSNAIPGHNLVLAALGVFILWFGWYGFNPGSTLAQVDGIAYIAVTTTLAASAGGTAALIISWVHAGKPDLTMALNGVLAGLVGITAPCASVEPWAAIVIGAVAGLLVYVSVLTIDRVFKIDDPVGAISVHGVCGAWGTLSIGLFGSQAVDVLFWDKESAIHNGLFYGGGLGQLGVQALGVVSVFVFTFVLALIMFLGLKATLGLRVSDEEQAEGLDLGEHDMAAYPDFQQTTIKSYQLREA